MTASAQGLSRRFLELRARESTLTADIAGCEAEVRAIEENRLAASRRLEELDGDLSAGKQRLDQAQKSLEDGRAQLKKAQEAGHSPPTT